MRPAHIIRILSTELNSARQGQHTPVMLWGPPGVGKSQMVAQVAAAQDAAVIDIRLSQMEPSDLRGIPFRQDDTVIWATPALLPNMERHGRNGILFLDEITSAPPSVSAAAYQLILDRKLGEYVVPDGWAIIAAGNRQGDRGVTYTMPAPLANRFSHYELETHLDDWVAWAWQNHIHEGVIAFLRFRPDLLFHFDPAENPVAFPSPRTWEYVDRALRKFASQTDVLLGALQACVGNAVGIELLAFIENMENIPDIDAVLAGESQEVPGSIDLQYAVASALVGRAIRDRDADHAAATLSSILNYAALFPQKEMSIMLVSDLYRAIGQSLFELPAFSQWGNDVADLMFYD